MSHIRIDSSKATKKWSPVLENMGVQSDRLEWMSEMAEYHQINENAYGNAAVAGMGAVLNPVVGQFPGLAGGGAGFGSQGVNPGSGVGSGDVGQNLLPVAMKIAAQTIGLDLVAVKPSPGPKIDLIYVDFQYDDLNLQADNARPQVFKVTEIDGVDAKYYAPLQDFVDNETTLNFNQGGIVGGQVYTKINANYLSLTGPGTNSKAGWLEFLGFSRVDGYPMFRAWRQANSTTPSVHGYPYQFDQTLNTFNATQSMVDQFTNLAGLTTSVAGIQLISALEDQLPGFSTNWTSKTSSGDFPMSREDDDDRYPGFIGPKISSKTIKVGTIEVATALRRTEIEDIKANTGLDIVQKMESVLVNELSQVISRQIVSRIFDLGEDNRESAPSSASQSITGQTIFDLDTSYVLNVGGETTHAVQRKLVTKIQNASNYIATEGRVGPAQYAITNGALAATLMDVASYTINPVKSKLNAPGQLYPLGTIGEIQVYVDPYMRYSDNRIVLGRKNNPDQPGLIFVPYLMAQSITVISEATMAPKMVLRSRYAVADVGFFPEKQFMTIKIKDDAGLLN
jgi:hypothetical protein